MLSVEVCCLTSGGTCVETLIRRCGDVQHSDRQWECLVNALSYGMRRCYAGMAWWTGGLGRLASGLCAQHLLRLRLMVAENIAIGGVDFVGGDRPGRLKSIGAQAMGPHYRQPD